MYEENIVVTYDEECFLLPNLVDSRHHWWSKILAPFWSMKMSSWCIIGQVNLDEVGIGNFDEADDNGIEVDIISTHDAVLEGEAYVSIGRWLW